MNDFVKFGILIIVVMWITAVIESFAVLLPPSSTYFVGFFAGIIVNAIISYVLMFEVDK